MTIIEKIKAEVERLLTKWESADAMAEELLSFISTLESEKPLGLEEEIERKYANDTTTLRTRSQYAELARHFYDLGCRRTAEKYDEIEYNRQRAEESVPKDLEEAANNYLDGVYGKMPHSDLHIATFIAGAKWQKEQMMKEAVDAKVDVYEQYEGKTTGIITTTFADIPTEDICGGVRIIIVKED